MPKRKVKGCFFLAFLYLVGAFNGPATLVVSRDFSFSEWEMGACGGPIKKPPYIISDENYIKEE